MSEDVGASVAQPDWRVSGSYFEACNCDAICPCRSIGGRPGSHATNDLCQFVLSWRIKSGFSGEQDLSGLDVVMAGFYDENETSSPWRVALYVDEAASIDQVSRISDIYLGRAGGTAFGNYAAAILDVFAVRQASIELEHDPGQWSIGVEGWVSVRAHEPVASDESVACAIPGFDHPGQEAISDVLRVDDAPLSWDVRGRCAFATAFDYRSDA